MATTLRDVADRAGVSVRTVSNVVHDYPHVRAETRRRVQAALDELDYHPNLSARGLRSGRTGVIGLAVPALRESYFAELADAVLIAAREHGLGVVVEQTGGDRTRELAALSGGRLRFVDGMLLNPVGLAPGDAHLLDVPFPLVLLGERIFDGPTDHVTMHNVSSARAATEFLLAAGRRRIAVIGVSPQDNDETGSGPLRLRGYREALRAAGVPEDPALVRATADWSRAAGAQAAQALLTEHPDVDAIFALNDTLALGALRALGESGVDVPERVGVIGFDNIDEGRFSRPSLSSIDPDRTEIAHVAVDLLRARIDGERTPSRTVKVPFRLIERESTPRR